MTILKTDYEAVFKEGFKLGNRLARAKINIMRASDSKSMGDDELLDHKYDDKPEDEDGYQEVQVGGSGN